MAKIAISDLFAGSESFMRDLSENEFKVTGGGGCGHKTKTKKTKTNKCKSKSKCKPRCY
jgi:hypothetical protein